MIALLIVGLVVLCVALGWFFAKVEALPHPKHRGHDGWPDGS